MKKATIGIIANPAAGEDIRRLVAHASTISSVEKVWVIKRIIQAIDSIGADEVLIMPDYHGLGVDALQKLDLSKLSTSVNILDMPVKGDERDSIKAAELMNKEGLRCIITIGGDGTNRVVAKGCGNTPLLPVSTGTNNVLPYMIDGTTAGLAAACAANSKAYVTKTKKLSLHKNGITDIALVDIAVSDELFIGARALWNPLKIKRIVATQGKLTNIGLSTIAGVLHPIEMGDNKGIYIVLGEDGFTVKAPIAPGLVKNFGVKSYSLLSMGDSIEIDYAPSTIALDGERTLFLGGGEAVTIEIDRDGPQIIDVEKTLHKGRESLFQEFHPSECRSCGGLR